MPHAGPRFNQLLFVVTLFLCFPCAAALGADAEIAVDCDAGGTISAALASAAADDSITLTLSGTCRESVFIDRDNVTLQGATQAAGIAAPDDANFFLVTADSAAQNLTLRSLTLDAGDSTAVFCSSGSSVLIDSVSLHSNSRDGVFATGNSVCRVANSTLVGGGAGGSFGSGVYGTAGAYIELVATTLSGFSVGIFGQSNASFLVGTFFGPVEIHDNQYGMVLEAGASAQTARPRWKTTWSTASS